MAAPFSVIVAINNTGQTITFDSNGRLNLKIVAYHDDVATGREISTVLSDDDFGFVNMNTDYDYEFVIKRKAHMNERNVKQAEVPENCRIIENKLGTAPGMWFEKDGCECGNTRRPN